MKKLDNKGFMLTETLVVAAFVIGTLVFIYTQFRTVNRSYTTSFTYNNAEELYALGNIRDYLVVNGLSSIGPASVLTDEQYIEITNCSISFLSESNYCSALMDSLNVKQVIVTTENVNSLKQVMGNDQKLSEEMKNFISTIKYEEDGTGYRIIAEFKNGTFATLKIG